MQFRDYEQRSFDPLDFLDDGLTTDPKEAARMAMATRTTVQKLINKENPEMVTKCWSLPGQLRKYAGFGITDGRVRTVYYLNITRRDSK